MVLATIFKRQQRTVLWSSAILIFTGTLILIGVGVIKLIKNNQPDFVALTGIIVALGGSGVLAYGAEKLRAKMREKDRQILQNASIQQEEQNGVVLTGRLDTPIARKYLLKPLKPDIWKRSVLIMSGRIPRLFWPICAVAYIAVINLSIQK